MVRLSTDANQTTLMTTTTNTARQFDLAYYKAQALKTRQYGHTYVHAGAPHEFEYGGIYFSVSGYGRSLQGGGHKYKVSATRDGKTVPAAELRALA
jgi:hypothetical protein